jgi:hypothetical protein
MINNIKAELSYFMALLLGKINNKEIMLPADAIDCSKVLATYLANKLGLDEYESSLYSNWSLENRIYQFERLLSVENSNKINPYSVNFLELGSGTGLFIVLLMMMGINAQGIEASVQDYSGSKEISSLLLRANHRGGPR